MPCDTSSSRLVTVRVRVWVRDWVGVRVGNRFGVKVRVGVRVGVGVRVRVSGVTPVTPLRGGVRWWWWCKGGTGRGRMMIVWGRVGGGGVQGRERKGWGGGWCETE